MNINLHTALHIYNYNYKRTFITVIEGELSNGTPNSMPSYLFNPFKCARSPNMFLVHLRLQCKSEAPLLIFSVDDQLIRTYGDCSAT